MKSLFKKLPVKLLIVFTCIGCSHYNNIGLYLNQENNKGNINGNVLVVEKDSILYEQSFGYAGPGKQENLTSNHRFQIGSIYKEFPAVAIMQLHESGKLSLEDTLSNYLTYLPRWSDSITIRHLLQYSSGLPKVDWESYFSTNTAKQETVLRDLSKIEKLEFTSGTDYIYSNYNPLLLMEVVEAVSQLKFQDYVEQRILKPHGIEGIVITYQYPYSDPHLMTTPFNDQLVEDELKYELFTVSSTAKGMYNWFTKLDNFEIITRESMKELSKEAIDGDNIQAPLGRCDWSNNDIKLHLHHGSSGNYEVLVRHHKQDNLIIVILTNQKKRNLHEMADKIYSISTRTSKRK